MKAMTITVKSKLPHVGTTIFTVMSRKAEQLGAINLSQGFPDFDAPLPLRELLAEHVAAGRNQYPPMAGVPALREQIAAKVARIYGADVSPELAVTVVPGATTAIFSAILALVGPGDEVITLDPSYDSYEPSITLAGARAIRVPLVPPAFGVDWQRVADSVSPRTRMIVINTPHNPTGAILSAEDMSALTALAERHNLIVLSDEVYEHLVYDGQRHESVLRYPALAARSLAVFSFGKTYHATGWKTGYCIGPPELTAEFRKVHQFNTFVAVAPIQYALADFMARHPEHYLTLDNFYQAKRDFFNRSVAESRFTLTPAPGTFFQLLDYSAIADVDDVTMCERLVTEHGVASIPLSVFCEHPPATRVLRFCFAKQESTLASAAERLCAI
ncbi:MAG: aminotransferase class I/II-fold pyridoxal phosphate-dependent enzyme [Gammaproteobacteria bacterium]|nr:aminotransferase class I/II-fold pyridoxal phosphate-dependent enzyme [Gammaproteobacteria bacterium]